MPELPEVELVVRDLCSMLTPPHTLISMEIFCPKVLKDETGNPIQNNSPLSKNILYSELGHISRKGKYIIFHFKKEGYEPILQCHLRMTGRFNQITCDDEKPQPYERIRFTFERQNHQKIISFSDVRRFGGFILYSSTDSMCLSLGPEPFDTSFVTQFSKEAQKRKKICIKSILLDQNVVAGVGNIYADEALFLSGISPFRLAASLSMQEIEILQKSLVELFHRSLKKGGSSLGNGIGNFSSPYALNGTFQEEFNVYHKTGLKCCRCSSIIQRQVIRGRSTHFCSSCQK